MKKKKKLEAYLKLMDRNINNARVKLSSQPNESYNEDRIIAERTMKKSKIITKSKKRNNEIKDNHVTKRSKTNEENEDKVQSPTKVGVKKISASSPPRNKVTNMVKTDEKEFADLYKDVIIDMKKKFENYEGSFDEYEKQFAKLQVLPKKMAIGADNRNEKKIDVSQQKSVKKKLPISKTTESNSKNVAMKKKRLENINKEGLKGNILSKTKQINDHNYVTEADRKLSENDQNQKKKVNP
jgi:hypothetical protein